MLLIQYTGHTGQGEARILGGVTQWVEEPRGPCRYRWQTRRQSSRRQSGEFWGNILVAFPVYSPTLNLIPLLSLAPNTATLHVHDLDAVFPDLERSLLVICPVNPETQSTHSPGVMGPSLKSFLWGFFPGVLESGCIVPAIEQVIFVLAVDLKSDDRTVDALVFAVVVGVHFAP